MKNLIHKLGKWLGNALGIMKQSIERFPLTLLMTSVLVMLLIISVHANHPDDYQNYLMVFALAMPFSAILKLCYEKTVRLNLGIQVILTVGFLVSYYLVIPEFKPDFFWSQYFVLLTLLYAVFFLVPYFPKREGLSLALVERAGKFFLTALYAFVLYLGLNAVFFSIESLFELHFPSELPADLFFCVSGFFGVPYFLGSLPEAQHQEKPEAFSKIFKTLLLYILVPIQSIYTLILYAYFVRLLVLQTLPEGLIGNLVLWYALLSFLTLFSVKDLRNEVPWLNSYMKIFSVAMVVPMVMLAIAMGIRIHYYGLTMARYLSVVAMIYLVMAYVLLPIKKRDVSIPLYIVAICMLTVSFFGMFSWNKVVLKEQMGRLENHLIEAGYTLNEKAWVTPDVVSDEQQELISSSLNYLVNHYEVDEIALLPEGFDLEHADQYLGFELKNQYSRYENQNYFNKSFVEDQNTPIEVRDVDYVVMINRYDTVSYNLYEDHVVLEKTDPSGKTAPSGKGDSVARMKLTVDGFLAGELDVDALARKAYEENESSQTLEFATSSGAIITLTFDFIEIAGTTKHTGEFDRIDYYQCWLKVSKK
ncbi:DUF4153 domain-containing protein [Fusibacter sp. 3D3]|uniref:DUF4153 domain-containing protein n=1 Tax=Fusibacter sp. 3D3 TaxID=1048380 RepID=UPI000853B57B|nr:DUF4153 domain-containing protein [Fusibacter sp. 3D3]GAU76808.1 hypothetical protein F3D3_1406 [Fusibacter sp. 3D3]